MSLSPRPAAADRETTDRSEELREFLLVLRRALLMIVRWIEKRYRLGDQE